MRPHSACGGPCGACLQSGSAGLCCSPSLALMRLEIWSSSESTRTERVRYSEGGSASNCTLACAAAEGIALRGPALMSVLKCVLSIVCEEQGHPKRSEERQCPITDSWSGARPVALKAGRLCNHSWQGLWPRRAAVPSGQRVWGSREGNQYSLAFSTSAFSSPRLQRSESVWHSTDRN